LEEKVSRMAEREWLEVPVFVHGITTERQPASHARNYTAFLRLVNAALAARGKPTLDAPPIMVEWGWEESLGKDKSLAEAERLVAREALPPTEKHRRIHLNPLRRYADDIREAFLYGFADMFYYVSKDGGRAVRDNVFRYLAGEIRTIEKDRHGRSPKVSLTFFAHSAGAVIVHDFLYRLFGWGAQPLFGMTLNKTRRMARRKKLRVRRLYTLGAPVTPLIFRSEPLIDKILRKEKLNPAVIGLRAGEDLANPRWVNFWDDDDLVAYPVGFLYEKVDGEPVVVDRSVDLGEKFPAVHSAYWRSRDVADAVAEIF
jgi:hypothetical protein